MKQVWLVGVGVILALLVAARWPVAEPGSALPPATASSPHAGTNIPGIGPVPTDPKELEQFKPKAERELIGALRSQGIYGSRDELKAAQDNGDLIWARINQPDSVLNSLQDSLLEPFHPRVIEALEHILRNAKDNSVRHRAATLLYRYGSAAGKDYLLSLVNQASPDLLTLNAALTLALNRESQALPGLRQQLPKTEAVHEDLQVALGRWATPEATSVIIAIKEAQPRSWLFAVGLAQQEDTSALPALLGALKTRKDLTYSTVELEGLVSRLGGFDKATWYAHMEQLYEKAPYQNAPSLLLTYDYAGAEVSSPHLLKLLRESIAKHDAWLAGMAEHTRLVQVGDPTAYARLPKPSPTTLMSGAASLLAGWNVKEAVPILNDLLPVVQKDGRIDPQLNFALGLALYRLDPVNWRDKLINIGMKMDHIDRIPEVAKLRPVAPDQMPKQSSLKWR